MKTRLPVPGILFLFIFSCFHFSKLFAQDLPGAPANWQTAPVGTLVIAMDNSNQACSVPTAGTYLFNLKAYGLAIFLLDVNYKLQWSIRAGKAKDGIDFSASAERISPAYAAAQDLDFRTGPILIYPADTTGADYAIRVFNSNLPDSAKVKVYRLTEPALVDIRYTLTRPPKAALMNDSCDIHRNFMEMASVPTMNYDCVPNAWTLRSGCYTIATEPHAMPSDLLPFEADSVYNFIMAGGNFLAECEGIQTYENLKKLQSLTGVIIDPSGGQFANFNNNVYYDNADMAYAQYQGTYRPWLRGAQKVWRFGSATINNFYSVTSTRRNATDDLYYVASVSKLTADTGSLVFYLGNHEYFTHDCHTCVSGSTINQEEINGIRLYLNAVLIPSKFLNCVNVFDIPLAVVMGDFTATKKNAESALLHWNSLTEKDNSMFFIEHSNDGKTYSTVGEVAGKGDTGNGFEYSFLHAGAQKGMNYYRLRMFSGSGKQTYSEVRKLVFSGTDQTISIFPNPASGITHLMVDARDGERILVSLHDLSGREILKSQVQIKAQKAELNLDKALPGMYAVVVTRENGEQLRGKLLVTH